MSARHGRSRSAETFTANLSYNTLNGATVKMTLVTRSWSRSLATTRGVAGEGEPAQRLGHRAALEERLGMWQRKRRLEVRKLYAEC